MRRTGNKGNVGDTGNIGNQDFDLGVQGNEALYFMGTREQAPTGVGLEQSQSAGESLHKRIMHLSMFSTTCMCVWEGGGGGGAIELKMDGQRAHNLF